MAIRVSIACFALSVCLACHHSPGPRDGFKGESNNPIPAENAKSGDAGWAQMRSTATGHEVELYLDRVSASAGDNVTVRVSADASQSARWELYRLGWYAGAGARKLTSGGSLSVGPQATCPQDTATGMIRCAWTPTFNFAVPADAVSGLYLVKVIRGDGFAAFAPLVVRDSRPASLYFQASVTTYQAYNAWGGASLYEDDDETVPGGLGTKVSFDRPYKSDHGTGHLLRYEAPTARFLERNGYDVSYTTNLDVSREGKAALAARGAFLSVGHDEYWDGAERDAVEGARDAGVPFLSFGANGGYWKTRLTDVDANGEPRSIVCFKAQPQNDPMAGTPDRTGRNRDDAIGRPESTLFGSMYESWVLFGHPMTVADPGSFLFAGTSLAKGDVLPGLVGYEYDRVMGAKPPGDLQVLTSSAVIDFEGRPGESNAVSYRAPSGALVFNAGSIYWGTQLDGPSRDARVERMTANLFHEALGIPVPDALQSVSAPPHPGTIIEGTRSVATVATGLKGPSGVARRSSGDLVVADPAQHRIFLVSGGSVQPLAGDGNPDGIAAFDNVAGLKARFYQPTSVAVAPDGSIYVADTHNHAIRKIGTDAQATVTTVAGALGQAGFADGPGTTARFHDPMGLSLSADGSTLYIADSANHRVRALSLASGQVSTVAGLAQGDGDGSGAVFSYPTATAAAADGRIFVSSSYAGKIKVILPGSHSVVSLTRGGPGFADGAGTSAQLLPQGGLAWDGSALYVADPGNRRIRKLVPGADASSTQVSTFAGSGQGLDADGSGAAGAVSLPLGLVLGADGTLFIADGGNGSIRSTR